MDPNPPIVQLQTYNISDITLTVLQDLCDEDTPCSNPTANPLYPHFRTITIPIVTANTIDHDRLDVTGRARSVA